MGYVVDFGLQNPELKILFQSDIRLLRYEMSKSGFSTNMKGTQSSQLKTSKKSFRDQYVHRVTLHISHLLQDSPVRLSWA